MTPDQYKSVLSDTTKTVSLNGEEHTHYATPTPNSSQSQPPKYKDMTQVYRNGANLCSAHPLLVEKVEDMDGKLDAIHEYFLLRKEMMRLIVDNKFISGIVVGVILLLIAYFTVL